jgi:hypothetical protein
MCNRPWNPMVRCTGTPDEAKESFVWSVEASSISLNVAFTCDTFCVVISIDCVELDEKGNTLLYIYLRHVLIYMIPASNIFAAVAHVPFQPTTIRYDTWTPNLDYTSFVYTCTCWYIFKTFTTGLYKTKILNTNICVFLWANISEYRIISRF